MEIVFMLNCNKAFHTLSRKHDKGWKLHRVLKSCTVGKQSAWNKLFCRAALHGMAIMATAAHLGGTAKQLAENALLDIIQLPYAGCQTGSQLLIDVRIRT